MYWLVQNVLLHQTTKNTPILKCQFLNFHLILFCKKLKMSLNNLQNEKRDFGPRVRKKSFEQFSKSIFSAFFFFSKSKWKSYRLMVQKTDNWDVGWKNAHIFNSGCFEHYYLWQYFMFYNRSRLMWSLWARPKSHNIIWMITITGDFYLVIFS